ncbi:MAG: HXXEE domain-containing protein [Peptococcaceae bacterium]|nr:HXXEE domain-containing protein [Peptococcaceae bacterium]
MIGEPSLFMLQWSWIGLGASVVLIILAVCTNLFRSDLNKSRIFDPVWLSWIGAAQYMLHNFEEYGVDLYGTTFSFPQQMTQAGMGNIGEFAYLACNIVLIWIIGPIIAVLSKKYPAMAPSMAVFALINGLSHIAQLFNWGYSAGLLTSFVLFLPVGIWTIYVCYVKERFGWSNFFKTFGVAFLYSVILIAGIISANADFITPTIQGTIMILDGIIALLLWYLIGKKQVDK